MIEGVLVAAVLIGLLPACSLLGPAPNADPMNDVWVEYENYTDDVYSLTFARDGAAVGGARIEPCTAGGTGQQLAEPFTVGIAPGPLEENLEPGAEVVDWRAWHDVGDGFVVVVIQADGRVTVETRAEQRIAEGICP
jgi:hypothetical protein